MNPDLSSSFLIILCLKFQQVNQLPHTISQARVSDKRIGKKGRTENTESREGCECGSNLPIGQSIRYSINCRICTNFLLFLHACPTEIFSDLVAASAIARNHFQNGFKNIFISKIVMDITPFFLGKSMYPNPWRKPAASVVSPSVAGLTSLSVYFVFHQTLFLRNAKSRNCVKPDDFDNA
jgi:hypothetical protein